MSEFWNHLKVYQAKQCSFGSPCAAYLVSFRVFSALPFPRLVLWMQVFPRAKQSDISDFAGGVRQSRQNSDSWACPGHGSRPPRRPELSYGPAGGLRHRCHVGHWQPLLPIGRMSSPRPQMAWFLIKLTQRNTVYTSNKCNFCISFPPSQEVRWEHLGFVGRWKLPPSELPLVWS